jgi:hypothetical protein
MDVAHPAIAALAASVGTGALGAAALMVQNARYQRKLRGLRAGLAAGRVVDAMVEELVFWPTRWFYAGTASLIDHGRAKIVLMLLRARSRAQRAAPHHALQLVHVLLDLGHVAEARDAVVSIAALGPDGRELRVYLDARVAIAEGHAPRVLAKLAPEPEPEAQPAWGCYRRLALADASAARGDRDGARRWLSEVPATVLPTLRRSNRPCAGLAAELLDGGAAPYR